MVVCGQRAPLQIMRWTAVNTHDHFAMHFSGVWCVLVNIHSVLCRSGWAKAPNLYASERRSWSATAYRWRVIPGGKGGYCKILSILVVYSGYQHLLVPCRGCHIRGRSSGWIGHQSIPHTGAPALTTWDLLPGKNRAATEEFSRKLRQKKLRVRKPLTDFDVIEHLELESGLLSERSKRAWDGR